MKLLKGFQRTVLASAVAVLAFGAAAMAAGPYNTDTAAGTCTGVAGTTDCTAAVGHTSVGVAGTLSVNEIRGINFGNVAVTGSSPYSGDGHVTLTPSGALSGFTAGAHDALLLLHGTAAGGVAGAGGQAPGHYQIKGSFEGGQTRVYISFADASGDPMDCNGDSYYTNTYVSVIGPAAGDHFRVNQFAFTETGNDVYGHYVANGGANTAFDVPVGATLLTDATSTAYPVGKYVGTFNIMVSY